MTRDEVMAFINYLRGHATQPPVEYTGTCDCGKRVKMYGPVQWQYLPAAPPAPNMEAMLRVCYQRLREGSTIGETLTFDAWKKLIEEQAQWPEFAAPPPASTLTTDTQEFWLSVLKALSAAPPPKEPR